MNGRAALELIKQHGIFGLTENDGCICGHFEVMGVCVDISCRKSSGGVKREGFYGTTIRVYSHHLFASPVELQEIAAEAVSQIRKHNGHLPTVVRFASYEMDSKLQCIFCHADRPTNRHLCDKCETGLDSLGCSIKESHPFEEIFIKAASDV